MSIAQSVLPEFDNEIATTRQMLELITEKDAGWKPHVKSFNLGDLGLHLASLLLWTKTTLRETEFDLNPPGGSDYKPEAFTDSKSLLQTFDANAAAARAIIAETSDADFMVPWTLKKGGQVLLSLPRVAVLRSFVMNHLIHHRGQLSVYLRQRDIPLPSVYGPTADVEI